LIRVTADTNIFVSALNYPGGKPFQLLKLAIEGKINLTVSEAILDEIEDVLQRRFLFSQKDLAEARSLITDTARTVKPAVQLEVIKEDPDDDRILECAVASGSDYIVTGDKDLLRLKSYDSIQILSVSDFLDMMDALARMP
jgi:putative PIN family toxin of toxin-antitoxin system